MRTWRGQGGWWCLLALAVVWMPAQVDAQVGHDRFDLWVEDLAEQAAELRELPLLEPVRARLIDREALVQELMDQLAMQYTPEELRDTADALYALGVWPDGLSFETLLLDLYQDQVAGFYSPLDRTLRLLDDTPLTQQAPIALHEIVHVLQDQHIPLMAYRLAGWSISDVQLARTAVVEGDAMAAMARWASGGSPTLMDVLNPTARRMAESLQPPSMRHVPAIIWQSTVFPYVSGMIYVNALLAEGGWAAVDAAYHRGPLSTREIMVPGHWLGCWEPVWLDGAWTVREDPGWEALDHDIIGERLLQVVLAEQLRRSVPARIIAEAAQAWRGDRLVVRRATDGALETAWMLLASGPEAAEHLADLLWDGAQLRLAEPEELGQLGAEGASRRWVASAEGGLVVEVRGALVVAVSRTRVTQRPETTLRAIAERASHMLETQVRYRYPEALRRSVAHEAAQERSTPWLCR